MRFITRYCIYILFLTNSFCCSANSDTTAHRKINFGVVAKYVQPIIIGEHSPDYILNPNLIMYYRKHALSAGLMFPFRIKKYGKEKMALSFNYLFYIKGTKKTNLYTGINFFYRNFEFELGDIGGIYYYRSNEVNRYAVIALVFDIKLYQHFGLTFNPSIGINTAKYELYERSFSNINMQTFQFTEFACLFSIGLIFKLNH